MTHPEVPPDVVPMWTYGDAYVRGELVRELIAAYQSGAPRAQITERTERILRALDEAGGESA